MAKEIKFEEVNKDDIYKETDEDTQQVVVEKPKKENFIVRTWKNLKKWQKVVVVGGTAVLVAFVGGKILVKVLNGNAEVAPEVVDAAVDAAIEGVEEAAL